jgi:SH3-like domain-containing protein
MTMPKWAIAGACAFAIAAPAASVPKEGLPYWASITPNQARMRTGPGRNYPASWMYQRSGLPVKVIDTYKEWRKIEDPSGTQGWMQGNMLSGTRTGMVVDGIAVLRASPEASGAVQWRAAPGVIGRISRCSKGWCWLDVKGRGGFVESSRLFGVDPGEELP